MVRLVEFPPKTVSVLNFLVFSGNSRGAAKDWQGFTRGAPLDSHVTAENLSPGFFQKHDPDLTLRGAFTHRPILTGLVVGEIVIHNNDLAFTVNKHS